MKKIYLFSFLLCCSAVAFAQWTVLNNGDPIGDDSTSSLRSPFFINSDTGIVVGELPTAIFKTTDGGTTWAPKVAGTSNSLRGVHFIDDSIGIICGGVGTILRTTDGGETWNPITSGTTLTLRSVDFTSHDTGYIAGSSGTVLKTIDAGLTWTPLAFGQTPDLIQIRFANSTTGYATSSTSLFVDGLIIKTTDAGATWNTVYSNSQGLLGLAAVGDSTVYAGGGDNQVPGDTSYAYIVKSSDGGTTWDTVFTGVTQSTLRAADFISVDTGWFVGDGGYLLHTTDGGATWTNQSVNSNGLLGIHFPTHQTGYAVGPPVTILKYPCPTLPSIDSISGVQVVCAGDTILYSINPVAGAISYTWNVPNNAIITGGNGSTSIIVLFGDSSGNIKVSAMSDCDTTLASLAVLVHALPDTPTITFTNDTLMSSSAGSYQWYYNGSPIAGATNQTYSPTQNGFYSVTVTNGADCSTSSLSFQVIGLGIVEAIGNMGLEIFPNPMSTSAVISVKGNSSPQHIYISDVQGKILRQMEVTRNQKITIDKKEFGDGMYLVSLLNEHNGLIARSKLIVQ